MFHSELTAWIVFIFGGFIFGSLMFSQVIPLSILGKNIMEISDDHNPGCTNVFIHCGPVWGILCLSLDILKGFIPVSLGYQFLNHENLCFAMVLAAPVLGHAIAPLNHFRGGKCIATAFGALMALFPMTHIVLVLGGIYIVFSTVLKISPNRIRSIAAFGLFGLISLIIHLHDGQYSVAFGCMMISIIAISKHSKLFLKEANHSCETAQ